MVQIRLMTKADIPFGMFLKEQAGWNQLEADWKRFLDLQPDGCFIAERSGQPVGTVSTFAFGPVAWIAMMLVESSCRGQGIGRTLMEHALASLDTRGVRTVRLDATPLGLPLYERLGFQPCFEMLRFAGVARFDVGNSASPLSETFNDDVSSLDYQVTRTDRRSLLQRLFQGPTAWTIRDEGNLKGFVTLRPGCNAVQIGPCIADDSAGQQLLTFALRQCAGQQVYIDIPASHQAARQIAVDGGLAIQRTLTRMNRGEAVMEDISRLWSGSGPEKG